MLRAQTVAFRQPLTLSVGGTRSFFWRSTSAAPTAQTTLKDPSCAPKSSSTETPSVAVEGSDTIGTALSRDLNTLNIKSAPMDPLPSAPESILPDAASVLTSPATSDLFTACLSLSHFAITPVLLGGLVALLPELVFKKQTEWRKYDLMRHENGDALVRTMRYIDRKSRNMAVDAKDVDVVKKTMDAFGVKDPTFFKQMTLMPFFQLGGVSVLYFETGRVSRWFMSPETSQLFSAADGSASSIWMTLAEKPLALALLIPTYFYYMREVNRLSQSYKIQTAPVMRETVRQALMIAPLGMGVFFGLDMFCALSLSSYAMTHAVVRRMVEQKWYQRFRNLPSLPPAHSLPGRSFGMMLPMTKYEAKLERQRLFS